MKAREERRAMMKLAFEPSSTIRQGRPTKRKGRELRRFKEEFR